MLLRKMANSTILKKDSHKRQTSITADSDGGEVQDEFDENNVDMMNGVRSDITEQIVIFMHENTHSDSLVIHLTMSSEDISILTRCRRSN